MGFIKKIKDKIVSRHYGRPSEDADIGLDVEKSNGKAAKDDLFESKQEKQRRELEEKARRFEEESKELEADTLAQERLAKASFRDANLRDRYKSARKTIRTVERDHPSTTAGKVFKTAREVGTKIEKGRAEVAKYAPRYSNQPRQAPSQQSSGLLDSLDVSKGQSFGIVENLNVRKQQPQKPFQSPPAIPQRQMNFGIDLSRIVNQPAERIPAKKQIKLRGEKLNPDFGIRLDKIASPFNFGINLGKIGRTRR